MSRAHSPLWIVFTTLLRYWSRHRLQCALCIFGIALGVAVVTAIDLANASSLASFRESLASVSGKATHQIVPETGSYQNGVPESLFPSVLDEPGVIAAAPLIESYGTILTDPSAPLPNSPTEALAKPQALVRILGIEPALDQPFRSTRGVRASLSESAFTEWLVRDDGAAISRRLAERLKLKAGDTFTLLYSGKRHALKLLVVYEPAEKFAQDDLMLMDIAAVQERFGMLGKLNSIDLILPEGAEVEAIAARLRKTLPEGIVVQRPAERASRTEALLNAFQLNLRALSLLALVVGMFLVYNTLTVAVLQRLPLLGTLRCLGASERETRRAILLESALFGAVGSIFGLLAGAALAGLFLERVGGIVSDLYAYVGALSIFWELASLIKGFALGVLASLIGAYVPAREAGRTAPNAILRRSRVESAAQSSWKILLCFGLTCFAIAAGLALVPGKSPVPGLAAAFALAFGGALCAPAVTRGLSIHTSGPLRRVAGVLGMLAARSLSTNLSRTGLAVGALGMALSMTVGVALMVSSFRGTLDRWMLQSLNADVYIRPAGPALLRQKAHIPDALLEKLRAMPEAEAVDTFRGRDVALPGGALVLIAATETRTTFSRGRANFPMTPNGGTSEDAMRGLLVGEALVSETLARKRDLNVGDMIEIPGAIGQGSRGAGEQGSNVSLRIAGIYHEYANDRGVISIDKETYAKLFGDARAQSASIYLKSGTDLQATLQKLREEVGAPGGLYIFSNRTLRDEAFRVFDRTFAITGQLENLSLAVGLCGIVSALLALLRERSQDFGLMRALGLSARGLFGLLMLEGTLLGLAAFLVACVLGPALALLLIQVINVRAFGWTILFAMHWEVFARAGLLALLMSIVAALYPAWRGRRLSAAEALREE